MEFNSQICTTREQSERLIALGLKKETADMGWGNILIGKEREWIEVTFPIDKHTGLSIPAWSLHRLIEMMPYYVEMYNKDWCLQVSKGYVRYANNGKEKSYIGFIQRPNTFDAIIDCIEWLIKEGYFNKEYLVNQAEIDEHCKGVLKYLDYIRGEEE